LPRNLASVRNQGLAAEDLEHWVIDGGSKDGTVEFLGEQPDVLWVSEPDRGLSHAVSKGVERATGEWIIWLNADDALEEHALSNFLKALPKYPETYVFCGAQKMFTYDGQLECIRDGWDYNLRELLGSRIDINQASTIVHRKVYAQVGLLDESYRHAMDYEWTVRAMHHFRCQPLPVIVSHYHRRVGSIMDKGMGDQFRAILRVRRKYGRSRFEPAELMFRWYIATEPLRRVGWLRRAVRRIKSAAGIKVQGVANA